MFNLKKRMAKWAMFSLIVSSFYGMHSVEASQYSRITEITSNRTENSRTYRNSNLSETIDLFPYQVFQQDETGVFQPIPQGSSNETNSIAYVSSAIENDPVSDGNEIKIGSDQQGRYRAYIKFGDELPELENKLLIEAKLQLFELGNTTTPQYNDPQHEDSSYSIFQVLEDWNTDSLNWENQPLVKEQPIVSKTDLKYDGNAKFVWDVTELIKDWYEAPSANHGISLRATDEQADQTLRSFIKNDPNLNLVPVLQISYQNADLHASGIGYGFGANSQKGKLEIHWLPITGAKGYKIHLFNGKEFETIDVGNANSWSSLKQNIWPTAEQLSNGEYHFRLDGSGGEFADQPSELYENAGMKDAKNPFAYYFKVEAYGDNGSVISEELATQIPDQTAPSVPENLTVNELAEEFIIRWDESKDDRSGVKGYNVTLKNGLYPFAFTGSTKTNQIQIPKEYLRVGESYEISVMALDGNQFTSSNYSLPVSIQATPRNERDAKPLSFTIPSSLNVNFPNRIRLKMKNTGYEEWSEENGYSIRIETDENVSVVNLTDSVASGEEKEFEFPYEGKLLLGDASMKIGIFHRETGWVGDWIEKIVHFSDSTSPELMLSSPQFYDEVKGSLLIQGNISDFALKNYTLSYGEGASPVEWQTIHEEEASSGDFQYTWNTQGITPGRYTLKLSAVDTSGNANDIVCPIYINIPPKTPIVYEVKDSSANVSGIAEAGVQIKVMRGSTILGSAVVKQDGTYTVTLPSRPTAGTVLQISASDEFGNTSLPQSVTVVDRTAPLAPKIHTVSDRSTYISGTTEQGTTVRVYKGNTLIGSVLSRDGNYSLPIQKQTAGTVLAITSTDGANNTSTTVKTTVLDKTPPSAPKVSTVSNCSKTVSGTSEKYSLIKIYKGTKVLASGTVNKYGKYSISIPLQNAGTVLKLVAVDKAKNDSQKKSVTVVDKIAPKVPAVNKIYSYHTKVTGKAEPYSYIQVKRGSKTLGTAKANSKGYFSVKIAKQKRGTTIAVTARDKANNTSKAKKVKVK